MTRVLPTIKLEIVSLTVTSGTPKQVKTTSTPCKGILVGQHLAIPILISLTESGPQLQINAVGSGPSVLPIADASLVWIDLLSGGPEDIGILIFK